MTQVKAKIWPCTTTGPARPESGLVRTLCAEYQRGLCRRTPSWKNVSNLERLFMSIKKIVVQLLKQGPVKQLLKSPVLDLYHENRKWTTKDILIWKGSGTNLKWVLLQSAHLTACIY